jgi:hypothetical protein
MTQALEYERRIDRPPSRALGFFANVTGAYPLLLLGSLYGQWLLSWWVIGHRPQPMVDDPKWIDGANEMMLVTFCAMMGFVPAGLGALALNVWYVVRRRLRGSPLLVRIIVIAVLWLGTVVLLLCDPASVLEWWFD